MREPMERVVDDFLARVLHALAAHRRGLRFFLFCAQDPSRGAGEGEAGTAGNAGNAGALRLLDALEKAGGGGEGWWGEVAGESADWAGKKLREVETAPAEEALRALVQVVMYVCVVISIYLSIYLSVCLYIYVYIYIYIYYIYSQPLGG